VQAVSAMEGSTGRALDVVHTYHRWYDEFPTVVERTLIGSGHQLFTNWEPTNRDGSPMSWASIANGDHDAEIDALAARLRGLPPILLSFSHEPELDYGVHGRAEDFAAAFRRVWERLHQDGVSNVRYVWNVMGLMTSVWLGRYPDLWPGAQYVDWVAWDPYNWATCRPRPWQSFDQTIGPFYDWLEKQGWGDKPFMLGEYGTVEKADDPAGKSGWLASIPATLAKFPNLRALIYFDLNAPPANCDWAIDTSTASAAAFAQLARSPEFHVTTSPPTMPSLGSTPVRS